MSTPLVLSILMLAYEGQSVDELRKEGSLEERRRQVFATYIQRMLYRRGIKRDYPPDQTISWLSWLARQMVKLNLAEIYPELFGLLDAPGSSWRDLITELPIFWALGLPVSLIVAPSGMLIVGLVGGVLLGLFVWVLRKWAIRSRRQQKNPHQDREHRLSDGWLNQLIKLWMKLGRRERLGRREMQVLQNVGLCSFALIGYLLFILIYGVLSLMAVKHQGWEGILPPFISGTAVFLILVGGFAYLLAIITLLVASMRIRGLLARACNHWVGNFPFRYRPFLDHTAERLLVHKVGKDYIFIHRLLLEYFASLPFELEARDGKQRHFE